MPSYKLMYWNSRGRAESARMLFTLAGVAFEDYRFKEGEWPELKGKKELFPLGQAPSLIIDGKALPHSKAINRHLAREFKLYGDDNEQRRQVDVICETVDDIVSKIIPIHMEKDEAKKKEMLGELNEKAKPFLTFLSDNVGERFFVGNKETLADVIVFWLMDFLLPMVPSVPTDYPRLGKFYNGIKDNSKLSEYLKNRPVTQN